MRNSTNNDSAVLFSQQLQSIREIIDARIPGKVSVAGLASAPMGGGSGQLWADLDQLLSLEGDEFVQNTYRVLFGREADFAGLDHFGSSLKSNALSKAEILLHLVRSDEGRIRDANVRGLTCHLLTTGRTKIRNQETFVRLAFQEILGVEPEAGSASRWAEMISRGAITQEDLLTHLYEERQPTASVRDSFQTLGLSSFLADIGKQLSYQQRILEEFLNKA